MWGAIASAAPAAMEKGEQAKQNTQANVMGGFNLVQGFFQHRKGKRMKVERPKYEVPEALKKNAAMYQSQAQGNMAGYGLATSEARDTTSNTIGQIQRQGGSASQRLAAIQGAGQTEANAMTNIAMQNEQAKRQATSGLSSARSALAEEEKNKFMFNKVEPYRMKLQKKRALMSAGSANMQSGFGGLLKH